MCAAYNQMNQAEAKFMAALIEHNREVAIIMKSLNDFLENSQSFATSLPARKIFQDNSRNGDRGEAVYMSGWTDSAEMISQSFLSIYRDVMASVPLPSNQTVPETTPVSGIANVITTAIVDENVAPLPGVSRESETTVQDEEMTDHSSDLFREDYQTPTQEGEGKICKICKPMKDELLATLMENKRKVTAIMESLNSWLKNLEFFTVRQKVAEVLKENLRAGEVKNALYFQGWLDYAEMAMQATVSIHNQGTLSLIS